MAETRDAVEHWLLCRRHVDMLAYGGLTYKYLSLPTRLADGNVVNRHFYALQEAREAMLLPLQGRRVWPTLEYQRELRERWREHFHWRERNINHPAAAFLEGVRVGNYLNEFVNSVERLEANDLRTSAR